MISATLSGVTARSGFIIARCAFHGGHLLIGPGDALDARMLFF
jgi:hypothetical protein